MGMKKRIAICLTLVLGALTQQAPAQSLNDLFNQLLGGVVSSASATEKTETQTTTESLKAESLLGDWIYAAPVVVFTGDDLVAALGTQVAVPTLKQKMAELCAAQGVVPGSATVRLKKDGRFEVLFNEHKIEGSYRFDEANQKIYLTVVPLATRQATTFEGKLYFSGGKLDVRFEADKLVTEAKKSIDFSKDPTLQGAVDLVVQYNGLELGCQYRR